VQFKKAVLRLDVTPQITADGRIIMVVEVRKDTVGQFVQLGQGFSVPSIDTKNVVTQISAVRAALRKVEEEILRDHVAHCVEHAIASGNKQEQRGKVAELMDVLVRSNR